MKEKLELKASFPVEPSVLYSAWLDSELHEKMTGGTATCSAQEGATFSTWDGYITGRNVTLTKDEKIVQTWRTSEFEDHDEDSILSITFNKTDEGTELTLLHTNIPEGQTQYENGWKDHYFTPMNNFFKK